MSVFIHLWVIMKAKRYFTLRKKADCEYIEEDFKTLMEMRFRRAYSGAKNLKCMSRLSLGGETKVQRDEGTAQVTQQAQQCLSS